MCVCFSGAQYGGIYCATEEMCAMTSKSYRKCQVFFSFGNSRIETCVCLNVAQTLKHLVLGDLGASICIYFLTLPVESFVF